MKRIMYLYVPDKMADWEPGYILAELGSGQYCKQGISYHLVLCGCDQNPVTTMGGMVLQPEISINEINPAAGNLLILPGSQAWADPSHIQSIEWVKELLKTDLLIGAICGATMALAQGGALNNRRHTSNDVMVLKMFCPGYTGESYYLDQPAVTDGNLITASGLAPIDFAYQVIKRLDVMQEEILDAWYNLNTTRKPEYYFALMNLVEKQKSG